MITTVLFCVAFGTSVCLFPRWHSWRSGVVCFLSYYYARVLVWGLFFAKRQTEVLQQVFSSQCDMAALAASCILLVEIKYRATLKHADEMSRADASSYDEIWKTFVADESKIGRYWAWSTRTKLPWPARRSGASARRRRASVVSLNRHTRSSPWSLAKAEAISGDAGVAMVQPRRWRARVPEGLAVVRWRLQKALRRCARVDCV